MSWGKQSQHELCAVVTDACVEGEQVILRQQTQLDAALLALKFAKEPTRRAGPRAVASR